MKLTVRFGDFEIKSQEMIHTGHMPPVNHRTVTIEMTPEQVEALTPRKIGSVWNNGKKENVPLFETREVIALEDDSNT